MKKLFILFLIFLPYLLFSQYEVSQVEADQWGHYVVSKYFPKDIDYGIVNVEILSENANFTYYLYNIKPTGFILISGNKLLHPIIGYSWESDFNYPIAQPAVKSFLNQISKFVEKSNKIHPLWFNDCTKNAEKQYRAVAPLLFTKWDQGVYYNQFCPKDPAGPDGRCVTGCVATALAQVINYFRWPLVGEGEYTDIDTTYGHLYVNYAEQHYSYNQMPIAANRENRQLAKLIYHIGVACDMYYGPDGSGMYNHKAAYAMKNFFRYDDSTKYLFRDESTLDWDSLLRSYLDQKIPLYYGGWSDTEYVSGHAFVVDGYQDTMVYHINWGWGGAYDGYFNINNLTPAGADFTHKHELIINMYPKGQYPVYCDDTDTLLTLDGTIDDGSGPLFNYLPNSHCSWLIKPFDSIQNIKLTFLKLDLPDTNDIIKIYEGDDNTGNIVATITGTNIPNTITVNGKSVFIEFISNDSVQGDGFLLSYSTTLYDFCTPGIVQIVADSGVINDGSGIYNYHNNRTCLWRITPENANNLLLTFNYFDIDSTDYLTIKNYDGSVDLELRGNSLPYPINIYSFPINILFRSSKTYNAQGFELVFKPDINSIASYNDDSYIYPNPFNNFLNLKIDNDAQLFIYSPQGQLIYSQYFYSGNNIINTANWSDGIYFVILVNNDFVFSKKIIKIYE